MSISLIKPSLCPHEISLFHPEIYDSYSGQPHEKHLHYLGKQNAHPAQKKYSIMILKKINAFIITSIKRDIMSDY